MPKSNPIKLSDLRALAQELIESNRMPPLEDVLSAVADAREKYREPILAARRDPKNAEE
jgi:hypothetical protein